MEFIPYRDPRIRYTGRWADTGSAMTATAPGSRFTLRFSGEMAVLRFDINLLQAPALHLYIQVDGGARVESTLERYIRISAAPGTHTVEVILKSMVEQFPRWNPPLTNRVAFEGLETDGLTPLPPQTGKTIEFVGDSITEGVLIDADHQPLQRDQYDRPFQDDVTATYAWLTAEKLGLIPCIMGYGAVGVTRGGCGGVVRAADAYPYCFAGAPIAADVHPDYVLVNHGTNDSGASAEDYAAGYTALLDAIRAAHPQAKIFAMSVFCGTHEQDLEQLIPAYNAARNAQVVFLNGSHWLPAQPIHPLRDGHRLAAEKLAELLRPLL